MSTTVWFLLAVCAVASVMHRALVVSQCTTNHCHDGDRNMRSLTVLVGRLQNTFERQQDSLEQQQREMTTLKETIASLNETVEQQRKQNQEERRQLTILNETVALQEIQLTRLEETLAKQNEEIRNMGALAIFNVHDCADLWNIGMSTSGVYNIRLEGRTVAIWCDMIAEGKSWLVFQRRVDNTTDFYRDWKSYKDGFGDPIRNFWLGNDNLHAITSKKKYILRVDLADFESETRFAEYTDFAVANEGNKYRLTLGSYSGTAGDDLNYNNGMAFSTRDRDNDNDYSNCAVRWCKGAWWYNGCTRANPNGVYLGGAFTGISRGIIWNHWHGYQYSLKTVAMKIRPQ